MEDQFIRGRLEKRGLRVIVPNSPDRDEVHRVIYEEFCVRRFEESSRQRYREVTAAFAWITEYSLLPLAGEGARRADEGEK